MTAWIKASLGRRFALALGAGLLSASLAFLVLFVGLYRTQLEAERTQASHQVNLLFQAALENAMLKRDLDGLSGIIARLGQQEGVRGVMILDPAGEVRFAADPALLHRRIPLPAGTSTAFITGDDGRERLRAINPVHNKEACQQCHGPMSAHPVNGVLLVDWDAEPIRAGARKTALMLILAGGAVVGAMLLGVWGLLHRLVLRRLAALRAVGREIGTGRLDVEAPIDGQDEIATLAGTFNHMLATIRARIRDVREREAFLQALVDAVPDAIRLIDAEGKIVLANRAYRRQLGLDDTAPLAGLPCHQSSHGRADPCVPTLVACPLAVFRDNPAPMKAIHTHRRADGSLLEVEVFAAPLRVVQDGRVRTYIVESIRDLAADVRFGHEQKLAAVGQLAAGVAHEIRNPLASIRLTLQALLRESDSDAAAGAVGAYLHLVDGQIDKCIDVTERLLKLSGGATESVQLVEVNPSIEETLSLLSYHAMTLGISIAARFDPAGPRVLMTDGDLRMVVLNLVQNAFHAMPGGGRLDIVTAQSAEEVRLTVADTGVGIAPALHRRIFEPFFSHRANGVTGTGLGLAICKSIIDGAGGRIELDSSPGAGARFTVILPSAAAAMDARSRADAQDGARR